MTHFNFLICKMSNKLPMLDVSGHLFGEVILQCKTHPKLDCTGRQLLEGCILM